MWRWAACAILAAGCGGADLCGNGVCSVAPPALDAPSDFHMVADDSGFVVVWGIGVGTGDNGGIWAARPGEAPVVVRDHGSAQVVAAAPVSGGVLLCWSSLAWSIDSPTDEGCGVLGDDLHFTAPPVDEPYGTVMQLLRVGGQLYAVSEDTCAGGPAQLTPIDDDGTPAGASVTWPCRGGAQQSAVRGDRIACLQPSDPLCGDQFDEPQGCRTMLAEYDVTGAATGAPLDVAPFGDYSDLADVSLAASDDGYLVAWWYRDAALHAQIVTPSLTLGADATVPADATGGLTGVGVTADGYAVTWAPSDHLEVVQLGRDGSLVSASAPIGDDGTLSSGYPDTVSFATDGVRSGAAWGAENLLAGGDHREGILFRELDH